jgi:hypothetical protein
MAQVTAPLLDSTTAARHFGIRYWRQTPPILPSLRHVDGDGAEAGQVDEALHGTVRDRR